MRSLMLFCTLLALKKFSYVASDSKPQYFVQRGETAEIPCLYGEGEIRNIHWHHNDGSGWVQVVSLYHGSKIIGPGHTEDRVDIDEAYTLTVRNITIQDEGEYQCDVDRANDSAVLDLYSELNVIVIPDSPVITQCESALELDQCAIHVGVDTPTYLSCELRNFYPSTEASLEWRWEDGSLLEPHTIVSTKNADGTANMNSSVSVHINGPKQFLCIASYLTVKGIETAGTPVFLYSGDFTDTPSKNLAVAIAVPIACVGVAVVVALIVAFVYNQKKKREESRKTEGYWCSRLPEGQHLATAPISAPPGQGDMDRTSHLKGLIPHYDFEDILKHVAQNIPDNDAIERLGVALDFTNPVIGRYISTNLRFQDQTFVGTLNMLRDWHQTQKTREELPALRSALTTARLVNLADKFLPAEPSPQTKNGGQSNEEENDAEETSETVLQDKGGVQSTEKEYGHDTEETTVLIPVGNEKEGASHSAEDDQRSQDKTKGQTLATDPKLAPPGLVDIGQTSHPISTRTDYDFEDILKHVAKNILHNDAIERLGEALGFTHPVIGRYISSNLRFQDQTFEGTLKMLRAWRQEQTKVGELSALRAALITARLINLADEVLPVGAVQ